MEHEDRLLELFCHEIHFQCEIALAAASDLAAEPSARTWLPIQTFLSAVANVSKVLWPSQGRDSCEEFETRKAQRRALRERLSVSDESSFRAKTFRNHFEHFDTRLEAWAKANAGTIYFDSNIGPPSDFGGTDPEYMLRLYDPEEHALYFRGSKYCFDPVIAEIEELWKRASVAAFGFVLDPMVR